MARSDYRKMDSSEETIVESPREAQPISPSLEHEKTISTLKDNNIGLVPSNTLPSLPYDLREHKFKIAIFWFFIGSEICFIPISFYYGISSRTSLDSGALFAIITSVFGFVSGYEYTIRGWRLLKKSDNYRPLNDSRRFWDLDSTHLVLAVPFTAMTGILIGFSIPNPPIVKGLAIPMPVGLILLGLIMSWTGIANHRRWRLKYFRLSSHVKGSICPPLTFCIMEDVVAVDGGGGRAYREAAMARYNTSFQFRSMLVQLLWFWALSALILGAALLAVIYTVREEIAYGLGWGVPTVWAAIYAVLTILWIKRCVKAERRTWKRMATFSVELERVKKLPG